MFLTALLFALAQGVAEFLPVSSSGLVLWLMQRLGSPGEAFLVVTALHAVTALAAVAHYRRACRRALAGLWRPGPQRDFVWRYAAAQTITVLVAVGLTALLTQTAAERWHHSAWLLGSMMLLNAGALLASPRRDEEPSDGTLPALTWPEAAWVGFVQGLAVMPGLSRSGLTIAAGLRAGLSPAHAAAMSFLLAPPVVAAATIYWTARAWPEASAWFASWQSALAALAVAGVAFIVALGALHWIVSWVRAGRLWWFAPLSGLAGSVTLATAAW